MKKLSVSIGNIVFSRVFVSLEIHPWTKHKKPVFSTGPVYHGTKNGLFFGLGHVSILAFTRPSPPKPEQYPHLSTKTFSIRR